MSVGVAAPSINVEVTASAAEEIKKSRQKDLGEFKKCRARYLLYK